MKNNRRCDKRKTRTLLKKQNKNKDYYCHIKIETQVDLLGIYMF